MRDRREWISKNRNVIPRSTGSSGQVEELRIKPSIFIPDALIISPR